ncbi:hypothetical protein HanPSC8_Chr13g0584661 [Helianthus annuus]|nr:hypothetical protein HanPSC8_Chr13g0584661 [Helianthus annuus]
MFKHCWLKLGHNMLDIYRFKHQLIKSLSRFIYLFIYYLFFLFFFERPEVYY